MVTQLSELLPLVVPRAPGVGEAEVLAALRTAHEEFCGRTGLWRTTCSGIDTVVDQADYLLALPSGADAFALIEARWNGVALGNGTVSLTADSEGFYLTFEDAYVPTAAETDALEVEVELKPSLHSNAISAEIATAHRRALAAKAVELLTGDPRSPAFNLVVEDKAHQEWLSQLTSGLHARLSGRMRGSIRTRGRSWLA
jgi:hypothetical protein